MGIIAFKVSINGEHQYTAGAEKWQHISAHVSAHHIDPDQLRASTGEDIPDLPTEPFDHLTLHGSVSVSGEDIQVTGPNGHVYTESKSGSYQHKKLSPGDVIEISIVETETPDSPEWADPNLSGPVALRVKPDEE